MTNEQIKGQHSFFGWRILALAIVTGGLSGPGQTIGVSVFVDQFISDLDLSRSEVSTAYLIGTLIAALGLPRIGQQIDRAGVRRGMTFVGIAFGAALVAMAGVQGLVTLVIGFVAIRLFGQGSLMLTSTIAVTLWFDKRLAHAVYWDESGSIHITTCGCRLSICKMLSLPGLAR